MADPKYSILVDKPKLVLKQNHLEVLNNKYDRSEIFYSNVQTETDT
jgi:hypothetical protein